MAPVWESGLVKAPSMEATSPAMPGGDLIVSAWKEMASVEAATAMAPVIVAGDATA